jgi:hypothetical protein
VAAFGPARYSAAVTAVSCTALLAAACAGNRPAGPEPLRHSTPQSSPVPSATGAGRLALGARYLAIAVAGNRRLETDFDRLDGRDRANLAAARADLRDIAATERLFDRRLASIVFPPATETAARLLVVVNESRARLTMEAAGAASLRQLQAYRRQLTAANGPVEDVVRVIRIQLGLPPAETS